MKFKLNEMAYERKDAIELCNALGIRFIEHFHKVVKESKESENFHHHCAEMTSWWNRVKYITLKSTKKLIQSSQLKDWFFEAGSSIEFIIETPYQEIYDKLVIRMLANYDESVEDILLELL